MSIALVRLAKSFLNAVGKLVKIGDVRRYDRKLIAAQSGNVIISAHAAPQSSRDTLEQTITHRMTQRIIHRLEFINVHVQQRELACLHS